MIAGPATMNICAVVAVVLAGLPVLDLQYYRLSYQYQQFWPLFSKVTLAMNTEIGYGDGYSGDPYPFFKNFYVGGIGSVRGYEGGSPALLG